MLYAIGPEEDRIFKTFELAEQEKKKYATVEYVTALYELLEGSDFPNKENWIKESSGHQKLRTLKSYISSLISRYCYCSPKRSSEATV